MTNIFFTSDTHFGHKNIIEYSKRPFASVEEMDDALIENINREVKPNDLLYHLGDWAMWRGHEGYRRRIHCRNIVLILGNHDRHQSKLRPLFLDIHPILHTKIDGRNFSLCHYAMRVWPKSHHGAWHLYGHSHGSLPD
jgi:calcineurin-like phosphoesterase family protein